MGWLTSGEAAVLFGTTSASVLRMLADPAHADFAGRVVRRGRETRFPAAVTWFYAHEGRMPDDRQDLADFLELFPIPDVTSHRRDARLVRESA